MPKTKATPLTEKQRLANRKNAQKSTGPKTPRGKAKSSRNALKHGLLAKDVVIRSADHSENQADFDALLTDFCDELQPDGLIEETLVERIATSYWRLRRAQRLEAGAIRAALETPEPQNRNLDEMRRLLRKVQADLQTELRLQELLTKPADALSPEESHELERSAADFVRAHFVKDVTPQELLSRIRELLPNVIAKLQQPYNNLNAKLQAAEQVEALRLERRTCLAALPDRDNLTRIIRYESMLNRQIHQALAELRQGRKVSYRGTERRNARS